MRRLSVALTLSGQRQAPASPAQSTLAVFRQFGNSLPVSFDQGQLLRPSPSFDLALRCEGLVTGWKILRPNERYGQSLGRVSAQCTRTVLSEAMLKIVGMPGVIATVIAMQEVGVEGHFVGLAFAHGLRQAQAERTLALFQTLRIPKSSTSAQPELVEG